MRHDLYRFSGHYIPKAAILIQRTRLGTHTGIIYRDEKDDLRLLDFTLDGTIQSGPWLGRHPHVIPNVDDDALDVLAATCRVVAAKYRSAPSQHRFGFRQGNQGMIDLNTGDVDFGKVVGATCATFVLLLLRASAIDLVANGPDWPHRPETDDPRHNGLLDVLRLYFPDPAYLAAVEAELPCSRVAPEEVAGAAMCPTLPDVPATQAFAERAARWVMELFDHNTRHSV